MHRRNAASTLLIAMVLAACGSGGSATPASTEAAREAPTSQRSTFIGGEPPADAGARVTISTQAGMSSTFTVSSCTNPGPRIINLQASGADGDLDLRASVEGGFRITGAESIEGQIDEILVADDGSVAASGTLTLSDAPDARVPFTLVGTPGSCR